MLPVHARVSSLEGRDLCTFIHRHRYTHTHISQQAASTLHQKSSILKNFTLLLQNTHTCILIILLHYHLAGDLILINCQNVINCVKIVMYIQFGMLTL